MINENINRQTLKEVLDKVAAASNREEKTKVLIIGSGGHAKSCIDVIENSKKFNIVGLIDNDKKKMIGKYKVIFSDNEILKIKKTSKNLVLGLGSLDNINKRVQVFKKFKKLGFNFPKIISKYALVSKNSKIGVQSFSRSDN